MGVFCLSARKLNFLFEAPAVNCKNVKISIVSQRSQGAFMLALQRMVMNSSSVGVAFIRGGIAAITFDSVVHFL